ncbi:MAG: hypothetical protein VXY01_00345, partial [Bacteroidota bacterium]|nr:hypothetical protein [Bacteroidota bacterium]
MRNQINSTQKVTLLKLLKPHHSVLTTGITTLLHFLISITFFFLFSFSLLAQDQTFTVSVSNGKFLINGEENPVITIEKGKTYRFSGIDHTSASNTHPIRFGTAAEYSFETAFTGVTMHSDYQDINVPVDSSITELYYFCLYHSGMGNAFQFSNSSSDSSSLEVISYSNVIDN